MSLTLKSLGRKSGRLMPLLAALLASACAESGLDAGTLQVAEQSWKAETSAVERASLPPVTAKTVEAPQTPLKPETLAAIRDARSLRDAGNKSRALGMLEKIDGSDKDPALLLERGLLSLELGQIDRATDLLKQAHDPKAPDWRQYSGLGAALSAQGKQQAAQAEFAKALELAPDSPAVLNNLALSYALDGKHTEAERLLRRAADSQGSNPQAKQNLALILGLRGNIDEARQVSEAVLPPDKAKSNVAYLEQLKSGTERVSKADPVPLQAIRAAAAAMNDEDTNTPMIQLASPN